MEKEQYNKILQAIAEQEGITSDELEKEMQMMIDEAFQKMADDQRKNWKPLLKGDTLTVEEFIDYMLELIKTLKSLAK